MTTRFAHLLLSAFATLCLLTAAPSRCQANFITYTFGATLTTIYGPDAAGLEGSTIALSFQVPATATYYESSGTPAYPIATTVNERVTISGASVAANNGMYSPGPLAFYPTFAGLFAHPSGDFPNIDLNVGGDRLLFVFYTSPTSAGSSVVVGDAVDASHFAPAESFVELYSIGDTETGYSVINTIISTSLSVPTPMPPTALAGFVGVAGLAVVRRRKSA